MAYQILARKWRPTTFDEIVGQDTIVTGLRNALVDGRLAQAYLFSGIRGVGKTTTARLLAKALNCENGPGPEPCNQCVVCREITTGNDLDVLEVDAATHSKVEQVRELAESLRYGPARDRFKVVILDEVHRLSRQAFDALLKIIEEPPPSLRFIFATTEAEAVPATIVSRCQEFRFRRVPAAQVTQHLSKICVAEKIEASPAALRLIAEAGEGSVRDALSLLDQLAVFGGGGVREEEVRATLGLGDPSFFRRALEAIFDGDGANLSRLVRQMENEGWDPRRVHSRLLEQLRATIHLSLGLSGEELGLSQTESEALTQLASDTGYQNLLRVLSHLLSSDPGIQRSELASLAVEVAWLRAAELPRLLAIEELLERRPLSTTDSESPSEPPRRLPPARNPRPSRPKPSVAKPEPPAQPAPPEEGPEPSSAQTEEETVQHPPPPTQENPTSEPEVRPPAINGETAIQSLVREVSRFSQPLAAHLEEARAIRFHDGELTIEVEPHDRWLKDALERRRNNQVVSDAVTAVWGQGATWTVQKSAPKTMAESLPRAETVSGNRTVKAVMDIFSATIENVEGGLPAQED